MMSVAPPGEKGTISRTGRVGYGRPAPDEAACGKPVHWADRASKLIAAAANALPALARVIRLPRNAA